MSTTGSADHSGVSLLAPTAHGSALSDAGATTGMSATSVLSRSDVSPAQDDDALLAARLTIAAKHEAQMCEINSDGKHECSEPGCTKAFTTLAHLARHIKLHSGLKPYKCQIQSCTKAFARRDNMMVHFRAHAKKLGKKEGVMLYIPPEPKARRKRMPSVPQLAPAAGPMSKAASRRGSNMHAKDLHHQQQQHHQQHNGHHQQQQHQQQQHHHSHHHHQGSHLLQNQFGYHHLAMGTQGTVFSSIPSHFATGGHSGSAPGSPDGLSLDRSMSLPRSAAMDLHHQGSFFGGGGSSAGTPGTTPGAQAQYTFYKPHPAPPVELHRTYSAPIGSVDSLWGDNVSSRAMPARYDGQGRQLAVPSSTMGASPLGNQPLVSPGPGPEHAFGPLIPMQSYPLASPDFDMYPQQVAPQQPWGTQGLFVPAYESQFPLPSQQPVTPRSPEMGPSLPTPNTPHESTLDSTPTKQSSVVHNSEVDVNSGVVDESPLHSA